MVMADLQRIATTLCLSILSLHVRQRKLPWYLGSYLTVTMRRPDGRPLDVAPDLFKVEAEPGLRTSWVIEREGRAPEFVLEVASEQSRRRDWEDKSVIYEAMGVREYALLLPIRRREGPRLTGYRRDGEGRWVAWEPDAVGALRSEALGGLGLTVDGLWVRLLDTDGSRLPSEGEWASAEADLRSEAQARAATETARRLVAEAHARAAAAAREKAEAEALFAEERRVAAEERAQAETAARLEAEARARTIEEEVARLREELRRRREDITDTGV
jgi:Uma2 family endonuclease